MPKNAAAVLLTLICMSPLMFGVVFAEDLRPNVVFIIVDDLNDLPLGPHGKPSVPTPNIDRIARRGVSFTNAHTNDPICAPSRACMMFGLYPQTTGLYWFENWRQNAILKTSVSLNRHLKGNGYSVFGTGKVYHGGRGDNAYDRFGYRTEFGPWPWDGASKNPMLPHPDMMYLYEEDSDVDYKWEHHFGRLSMIPDWPADPNQDIPGYRGWRLFGKPYKYVSSKDRDPLGDELCAQWSTEVIQQNHDKPYALFTGLVRTHTPLYAPDEYFDRFPLDSIELPETIDKDLEDCAEALADRSLYGFRRYKMLTRHSDRELYKHWLQAYMACVSFVDDQVGKILDAIEKSPERDNTIVVFTSDHGFHVGEKEFLYKQSLWDGATRVPMIIAGVEGMPQGVQCHKPVSLIDLYPTLIDLCELPVQPNEAGNGYRLEGHSLRPLLMDPSGDWMGPSVAITALPGKDHSQHNEHGGTWYPHFSVRSENHRYTLCTNGEEELYDYTVDPLEWNNLADDPAYAQRKAKLNKQLIALRDGDRWESLGQNDDWNELISTKWSDGVLQVTDSQDTSIVTRRAVADFEFEFEAKVADLNSIRFRYHIRGDSKDHSGVVANIPPETSNLDGSTEPLAGDQWNRYRIRVLGDRCQVWFNGRLHSDIRGPGIAGEGRLSIQFLGEEALSSQIRSCRFRSI
ncbi:MAG: sulfatase-like hydrolase/transferase [Planctomycetota bacterium]